MKICPKCNNTVVADEKQFCYQDGSLLRTVPKCQHCGEVVSPAHDKFCEYCGAPVEVLAGAQ